MFSLTIQFDTMNSTSVELNKNSTSNCELYLLVIVIKLSILMAAKIGQVLVRLYTLHNERVIDKHNSASVARLRKLTSKTSDDLEAGSLNT